MKRVCMILALSLAPMLAWSSPTAENLGHCVPHCTAFEKVGDDYFMATRGASGQLLALTDIDSGIGSLLVAADMPPLLPSSERQTFRIDASYLPLDRQVQSPALSTCKHATVETDANSDTTHTHIVVDVKVFAYCDGQLVEVDYLNHRFPISGAEPPPEH